MNKNNKKDIINKIIIFILFLFALFPSSSYAEFNPNYIISNEEVLDYDSMTLEEIQSFLENKGGYLAHATFICPEDGKKYTAAEIIYDRAITNKISPKFLIVLLQKEQSLIEDKNPKQSQLDWATGYGCPDGGTCNPRWKGFWKQVNSASLQFRDYMDNPHLYKYQAGKTYIFTNPYSTIKKEAVRVTPVNRATAALYNYTPHVYNGNYNFYKIWQRYFTRIYPNGSLLRAEGEPGVWLIQNGKKRPFLTKGALTSRFDVNKIITVKKTELDAYEKGDPIKFPQYSLVRSPNGTIYLLIDDTRRGFVSGEAFRKIGFNPEEVIDVSWEDLKPYKEGEPITASSTYPTGALLQDNTTGGVYYVTEGTKAPLLDAIFLKTKFKNRSITPVSPEKLASYKTVEPVKFDDGELLKANNSPAVYVIEDGKKRPIVSAKVFESLGYKWENIITVPPKIIDLYPDGKPLTEIIEHNEEVKNNNGNDN